MSAINVCNLKNIYILFFKGYSVKKIKSIRKYRNFNIQSCIMKYIFLSDEMKIKWSRGELTQKVSNILLKYSWEYQNNLYENIKYFQELDQIQYLKTLSYSDKSLLHNVTFKDIFVHRNNYLKRNITDKNRWKLIESIHLHYKILNDNNEEFMNYISDTEKIIDDMDNDVW